MPILWLDQQTKGEAMATTKIWRVEIRLCEIEQDENGNDKHVATDEEETIATCHDYTTGWREFSRTIRKIHD
jgi:hypothetical protein